MPADEASPSKTQLKKQMHELQQLGAELAQMPGERLATLPIPEALLEAVRDFQRTRSHEARRRQMQYIGKLMRQADAEPIRKALAAERLGGAREALALHGAERWRDQLLASDEALAQWMAQHPASDLQQLRSLVRAARGDSLEPATPGAAIRRSRPYRDLFQFIKAAA